MGYRASYVLIEDGAIAAYVSHWGAKAVPSVVLGGFAQTRSYLRALAPADGLLAAAWSEGRILLDADTRTLLFWGGESLLDHPDLRRLLLPLLRLLWPGWSVEWASHGVADLATYPRVAQALDLHPGRLLRDDPARWTPYTEREMRIPRGDPWTLTIITVKWDDAQVADYTFDRYPYGYLTAGASLLDRLRGRA